MGKGCSSMWRIWFLYFWTSFIIDDSLFWEHAVVVWTFHHTDYMRVWGGYLDPVMECRIHHASNFFETMLYEHGCMSSWKSCHGNNITEPFKQGIKTYHLNQYGERRDAMITNLKIITCYHNKHVQSPWISIISTNTLHHHQQTWKKDIYLL